MSRSTRLRHGLTLLLTTTTILAATGCGGGDDDDPKPSKAAAAQADMIKFAKCMREHGVDMPDPKVSGDGRRVTMMRGDDGSSPAQGDKAFEACKKFQPKAPAMSPKQRQAANDRALKHAKCMREHGVDVPDPKPGSPTKLTVKPNDSTFEAAMKACGESGGPMLTAAPAQ